MSKEQKDMEKQSIKLGSAIYDLTEQFDNWDFSQIHTKENPIKIRRDWRAYLKTLEKLTKISLDISGRVE